MAEQSPPEMPANVAKYAMALSFFEQQLPVAKAKIEPLRPLFEEASKSYAACIKSPNRNRTELKARMKAARDCDSLLADAKARVAGIGSRININIRNIALTRCNSVSAQVVKVLPSEIRNQIYIDCLDCLDEYDECDLICDTGFSDGRFTNGVGLKRRTCSVPLVSCWLKDYPDRGPCQTMEEWLGETFTSEMVAEWYRQQLFHFHEPSPGYIQSFLLGATVWGTQLVPQHLVRSANIDVERDLTVSSRRDHNALTISDKARYVFRDLAVLEPEILLFRPEVLLTIDLWDSIRVGPLSMDQFIQALDVVARRLLDHFDAITLKLFYTISVKLTKTAYSIEDLRVECEKIGELDRYRDDSLSSDSYSLSSDSD